MSNAAPSADPRELAAWFAALSDPTRLQIVQLLIGGERCVCDLQDAVGAYQSRLSFHLRRLKDARLVFDRKEGRWVYYSLNPEVLEAMAQFLACCQPEEHAAQCACGSCC